MDQDRARSLLIAERDEVQGLLKDAEAAGQEDRQSEVDSEQEDIADAAQPLTAEGMDDAIAESLRSRLDAIERALHRLDDGTYGRSVRSGSRSPTSAWKPTRPRNSPSKKPGRTNGAEPARPGQAASARFGAR